MRNQVLSNILSRLLLIVSSHGFYLCCCFNSTTSKSMLTERSIMRNYSGSSSHSNLKLSTGPRMESVLGESSNCRLAGTKWGQANHHVFFYRASEPTHHSLWCHLISYASEPVSRVHSDIMHKAEIYQLQHQ